MNNVDAFFRTIPALSRKDMELRAVRGRLNRRVLLNALQQSVLHLLKELNLFQAQEHHIVLNMYDKGSERIAKTLTFPMTKEKIQIGKQTGSDVEIQQNFISRLHAEILCDGTACFVTDKHSTNGTYVDGVRLEADSRVPLKDGNILHFGAQKALFQLQAKAKDDASISFGCSPAIMQPHDLPGKLRAGGPILHLRLLPDDTDVYLQVDIAFFYRVIQSILGFAAWDDTECKKPVTSVDEGLFLYFFIQVLEKVNMNIIPKGKILVYQDLCQHAPALGEEPVLHLPLAMTMEDSSYGFDIFIADLDFALKQAPAGDFPAFIDRIYLEPDSLYFAAGKSSLRVESLQDITVESILIIEEWFLKTPPEPNAGDYAMLLMPEHNLQIRTFVDSVTEAGIAFKPDQISQKENDTMSEMEESKEQAVKNLEATVYVVMGRKKIPLAKIAALADGDVIAFDQVLKNEVTLMVNGKHIAQGRLVEVEGKIGVEVTHVL